MDPTLARQLISSAKTVMAEKFLLLDPTYIDTLQQIITDAKKNTSSTTTYTIPEQNIISLDDFPLYLTWYFEDNAVTQTPFFFINNDGTITLELRP